MVYDRRRPQEAHEALLQLWPTWARGSAVHLRGEGDMSQFDDKDQRRAFYEWLMNNKARGLYTRAMTSRPPMSRAVRTAIDSAFLYQTNVAEAVIDALWQVADSLYSELERQMVLSARPLVMTMDKKTCDAYLAGEVRRLTELVEQLRAKGGHA